MQRFCTGCGSQLLQGAQFCTKCGSPISGLTQPGTANTQAPQSSFEANEQEEKRRYLPLGLLAGVLLIIFSGAAWYFFSDWYGSADDTKKLAGPLQTPQDPAAAMAKPSSVQGTSMSTSGKNIVAGKYTAFIADQKIELIFDETPQNPLRSASGRASYANTVNGGGCIARLIVDDAKADMSVTFAQVPIVGQKPCEKSIPLRISILDASSDTTGAISTLHAEWLDSSSGQPIMSGNLARSNRP